MESSANYGSLLPRISIYPRTAILAALALCLVFAPAISAQKPAGAGTPSNLTPAPSVSVPPAREESTTVAPKKVTLADLSWLAGRWQGQWGPRIADQVWMPAKAGVMLGIFRVIGNDKTLVVELLTLSDTPNGIEYSFRHFTPSLVPWEKSDATVLSFASADSKKIVFENPSSGQPKHAILESVDANTYVSRSEIMPDQGDPQIVQITYHRQKDAPAPR